MMSQLQPRSRIDTEPVATAPAEPIETPDQTAQTIIWIASYPKSGNTWVRVFLHNLLRELSGTAAPQDINLLHEHTIWAFGAKPFEAVLGKPFQEASHRELAEARPRAQSWLARSRPGPFLAKTHLCIGREFEVPTINFDVTLAAIYVVRNPLDVAISFAHHLETIDDATIATALLNFTTQNQKRPLRGDGIVEPACRWLDQVSWAVPAHIIRYEDMLGRPAPQLRQAGHVSAAGADRDPTQISDREIILR